jgi:hypothetical protein
MTIGSPSGFNRPNIFGQLSLTLLFKESALLADLFISLLPSTLLITWYNSCVFMKLIDMGSK